MRDEQSAPGTGHIAILSLLLKGLSIDLIYSYGVSLLGTYHIKNDIVCQDYHKIEHIGKDIEITSNRGLPHCQSVGEF